MHGRSLQACEAVAQGPVSQRPAVFAQAERLLQFYGLVERLADEVFDGPDDSSFIVPGRTLRTVASLVCWSKIRVVEHDQGVRRQQRKPGFDLIACVLVQVGSVNIQNVHGLLDHFLVSIGEQAFSRYLFGIHQDTCTGILNETPTRPWRRAPTRFKRSDGFG